MVGPFGSSSVAAPSYLHPSFTVVACLPFPSCQVTTCPFAAFQAYPFRVVPSLAIAFLAFLPCRPSFVAGRMVIRIVVADPSSAAAAFHPSFRVGAFESGPFRWDLPKKFELYLLPLFAVVFEPSQHPVSISS